MSSETLSLENKKSMRDLKISLLVQLGLFSCALVFCKPLFASPAPDSSQLIQTFQAADQQMMQGQPLMARQSWVDFLSQVEKLPAQEVKALSPEIEIALRKLHSYATGRGNYEWALDIFSRWGDYTNSPVKELPQLVSLARFFAGGAALFTEGNRELSQELLDDLGLLNRWALIGPFDNERGGGYEKSFSPEESSRPDFSQKYEGKTFDVAWRTFPKAPPSGYFNLKVHFQPAEQALAYAMTFVESDDDQECALRFATTGAYQIWINGESVAKERLQRKFTFDQSEITVQLKKGFNSILIKSLTEAGPWAFRARLSHLDGSPLKGWKEASPPPEASLPPSPKEFKKPEGEKESKAPSRGAWEVIHGRAQSEQARAHDHYVWGVLNYERHTHDRTQHPDREAFKKAIQLSGDKTPSAYHFRLAQSYRRLIGIEADRDDNAWRVALEAAFNSDPPCLIAYVELGNYYLDTFSNVDTAERYTERALHFNPDFVLARFLQARIHSIKSFPNSIEGVRRRLEGEIDPPVQVLRDRAVRLISMGEEHQGEDQLRTILRKNIADSTTLNLLLDHLLNRNRVEEALGLLRDRAELLPFNPSYLLDQIRIHRGRDQLDKAIEIQAQLLEVCPDVAGYWKILGDLVQLKGNRALSFTHYQRALELRPNYPELQEYLDFLQSRVDAFVLKHRIPADPIIEKAHATPFSNDDPAETLLLSSAVKVNPDGTTKEFHQEIFRVTNERGLQLYKVYRSYFARGDQQLEYKVARVIHKDGSENKARLESFRGGRRGSGNYAAANIELPPLEVGDIVEVQFVREDLYQSFFGDYFGRREFFKSNLPIRDKRFTLVVPKDKKLHFHYRNLNLPPQTEIDAESGDKIYHWKQESIAKIKPEPGMPPSSESSPLLEISTFENWREFSDWYWNLIREQHETSPEIQEKVRELTSGIESNREKIRALYNYVAQKVRYNAWEFGVHGFKPYNAPTIFARSFGDCKDKATLLTVMLKEVGIESHPVLIYATPTRSDEDLTLPMVNHFNHCITYIPEGEGYEEFYLDGTALYNRIEELPSSDRGAEVLIVRPEGGNLQTIPWNRPQDLAVTEDLQIELQSDGSATMEIRGHAVGDLGSSLRSVFEIAGKRKRSLERIFGSRYAGVEIISEEFSELGVLKDPASYKIRLKIPQMLTEAPEGLSLKPIDDFFQTSRLLQGLGSLEKREYDLLLGPPRKSELTVTVHLPEDYQVKSLPESFNIEKKFGTVKSQYSQSDNQIKLERVFELTTYRVNKDSYSDFRELVNSIQRHLDQKWLLTKKEEA